MHRKGRYKMTPQEIQSALARGMAFDAVMAQHAADIQREQGMDMGLSMARARTDVQNIQNARDEGIDPPTTATPRAKTIGAEGRRLSELDRLLTGAPPRPAAPDLTQLGAQAIAGLPDISGQLQDRLRRQQLMDISTGDVPLTPSQQVRQDALLAQLRAEPQYQAALQTQADMPTEVGRFAAAKAAIPQNIPRDILAALRGMPPSALRDESITAVQNLPNIPPDVPLDPNEFARFATPAGDISQSDISDFIRRAVTPTPSFTEQAAQPIAGTLPAIPSDFSDFEGLVGQPSATMAAGDIGRFARAGQPIAAQPIAGLDPNEAARIARRAAEARLNISAEEQARRDLRARDAATITGSEIAQEDIGLGSPDLPTRKTVTSTEWGDLEYHGLDQYGQPIWLPKSVEAEDAPMGGIWGKGIKAFSDYSGIGKDLTEEELLGMASTEAFFRGEPLLEFQKLLTDKTNLENDLADLNRRASLTNDPKDIEKVVEKQKEVSDINVKVQAEAKSGGFDVSELEGLQTTRTGTFYKPENEEQLEAAKAAGIIPTYKTLQQARNDADNLRAATAPRPATQPPIGTQPPVGTPPVGTPPIGTPPMGTSVIGGGGFAPAPAATLAGLGELGGVLGDRSQYVQSMLTPEQQLARYSSFLPTTALTPQLEEYMQDIALPQMEAAFYAQGGDLPDSPYATTAGSPYSAFENFMRTGSRLDPAAFQEYLGEVSGALQAGDPTQRQQFLSSMYASPEQQLQLLYQGMGAGTSAATRGALGRMLGRQYRQQQFQSPASAFLPSALARGGIGGAFSQYITPQGTVAAAGQPPAMSTIMANQGMPPARPRTTAEIMATIPSYTDRTGTVDMEAAMYPELYDTAQPAAIPPAAIPAPVIAPTPVIPQSVQSTMPKVNFADAPSVAYAGQGGGLYDPTTYNMTSQEYQAKLTKEREGLTPRYDITGTNIIGYDALGKGQAMRTWIDDEGNQQNMIVNDPNLISGTTKKKPAAKPAAKKKKKKKTDKVETPSLIAQGEMP